MAGSVVTVEVNDPHEITPTMWEHFRPTPRSAISTPEFLARTYRAADWRRYQTDPRAYHTTVSVGKVGPVCFVRMSDRQATDMVIGAHGLSHACMSFTMRGSGQLRQPGVRQEIRLDATACVVFFGTPGNVLNTGADAEKINVWIPSALLDRQAELLSDGRQDVISRVCREIDTRTGVGASLRRIAETIYADLDCPDSLLQGGIGASAAQELLAQAIVAAIWRGSSGLLGKPCQPAAPGSVKRAEDYMRSQAGGDVTVEDLARVAGCSVRALQAAFRKFRGVSPMQVLLRIRLEHARRVIETEDAPRSVIELAAIAGFSNPGRFAAQYRHAFGEFPSDALRRQATRDRAHH